MKQRCVSMHGAVFMRRRLSVRFADYVQIGREEVCNHRKNVIK